MERLKGILKPVRVGNDLSIDFNEQCLIRNLMPKYVGETDKDLIEYSKIAGESLFKILGEDIICALNEFSENYSSPYLLIRGFPVESVLPCTPYDGKTSINNLTLSLGCLLGVYNLLGINPVAYQSENNENLIRHVVPSISGREEKSSHGSEHKFGMHVDNPDLPLLPESIIDVCGCPEFLSLYSLRCDNRVTTDLIVLEDVLELLPSGVIDSLQKPLYKVSQPDSFWEKSKPRVLPILVNSSEYYSRFDYENVSPVTEEGAAALYMLRKAVTEKSIISSMVLLPGDLLIFRNQITLHSRGGFRPKDNGIDRWLLRLFGVKNLDRHLPMSLEHKYVGKTKTGVNNGVY